MTNAEAIEKIITFGSWLDESPLRDALDMAIAALRDSNEQKAEESLLTEDTDSVSKGDVIYRQAAIEALENTKEVAR